MPYETCAASTQQAQPNTIHVSLFENGLFPQKKENNIENVVPHFQTIWIWFPLSRNRIPVPHFSSDFQQLLPFILLAAGALAASQCLDTPQHQLIAEGIEGLDRCAMC